MKTILYVVNGFLVVAVIVLFVLVFTIGRGTSYNRCLNTQDIIRFNDKDTSAVLPVAYVNVDSLLSNYEFAKVSSDKLMEQFKGLNMTLSAKQKQLQIDVAEFQRKVQNNAFLTQDKAQQEASRLQKREAEFRNTSQQLQSELAAKEQQMNEEMADSVSACLKYFNVKAGYHIIFSNKGLNNILLAKPRYNITPVILKMLNKRYLGSKRK